MSAYRCNRSWGDNPFTAMWYAARGQAFYGPLSERLSNEDWMNEVTIEMDWHDEWNPEGSELEDK